MTGALDVLDKLTEPGQTLSFCDDTDISGAPVEGLAPNLRILCAVVMPSERYAVAAAMIKDKLQSLGQAEFHATEIVNPKSGSLWKPLSVEQRIDALRFLGEALAEPPTTLYYAYVSKGQYTQLRAAAEKIGAVRVGHKMGLKRVFLRCLFHRLGTVETNTVVVLDQDKPLTEPMVEIWPEGHFLLGGGPISAISSSVAGLQLADMAVFSIGRYLQKRQAIAAGNSSPFDQIALQTVASFHDRCEHLLNGIQSEDG